jgi:hypothetical protein
MQLTMPAPALVFTNRIRDPLTPLDPTLVQAETA